MVLTARCTIPDRAAFLERLRAIAAAHSCRIVLFNADRIAGSAHAALAVTLAERAFDQGANISNTLEMEALLFASGSRQCNVAISFGINEGENRLFVCCVPLRDEIRVGLESLVQFTHEDGDALLPEKQKVLREAFGISPAELAAAGGEARLADLVLERVALLQVMR
jgi:KEOPS complex subunit Cgi121